MTKRKRRKPKDTDGDGVPDFRDCDPKDPKKHSFAATLLVGTAGSLTGSELSRRLARRRRAQLLKKKRFFK